MFDFTSKCTRFSVHQEHETFAEKKKQFLNAVCTVLYTYMCVTGAPSYVPRACLADRLESYKKRDFTFCYPCVVT